MPPSRGAQQRHGLVGQGREYDVSRRVHAPASGEIRAKKRKSDANGPIAPQISALRRAFRLEKAVVYEKSRPSRMADPGRPKPQTLTSRRNLVACHGISSVKKGLGRPQTGSALHHLVTSVSVKKALMDSKGSGLVERRVSRHAAHNPRPCHRARNTTTRKGRSAGDAPRTHSAKMRSHRGAPALR